MLIRRQRSSRFMRRVKVISTLYITYIVRTYEAGRELPPLSLGAYPRAVPHRITLERNTLRFAAAHFTTAGGECEPLHGHNYDVFVQIDGALSADSWVIDFGEAKRIVRGLCQELDHRFLLATSSRDLEIDDSDGIVTIRHRDRRYVMPKADVAELDIDDTTAERLAEWCGGRLSAAVAAAGAGNLTSITVGIEEMPGQAGWFTLDLG